MISKRKGITVTLSLRPGNEYNWFRKMRKANTGTVQTQKLSALQLNDVNYSSATESHEAEPTVSIL